MRKVDAKPARANAKPMVARVLSLEKLSETMKIPLASAPSVQWLSRKYVYICMSTYMNCACMIV
jgi:hypothetical protein